MHRYKRIAICAIFVCLQTLLWSGVVQVESVAYNDTSAWWNAFTYIFFHANIFHLVVNILSLYGILRRWRICAIHFGIALVCAVIAAFLTAHEAYTLGCSGFILAISGIISSWHPKAKNIFISLGFLLAFCLIPNINGMLHIVAWVGGFVMGRIRVMYLRYQYDRKGYNIGK